MGVHGQKQGPQSICGAPLGRAPCSCGHSWTHAIRLGRLARVSLMIMEAIAYKEALVWKVV
jgi:hypothetical protein